MLLSLVYAIIETMKETAQLSFVQPPTVARLLLAVLPIAFVIFVIMLDMSKLFLKNGIDKLLPLFDKKFDISLMI